MGDPTSVLINFWSDSERTEILSVFREADIRGDELEQECLDLLQACRVRSHDEEGKLWEEAGSQDPSKRQLRINFTRIYQAKDPIGEANVIPIVRWHFAIAVCRRLGFTFSGPDAFYQVVRWKDLSKTQKYSIRQIAYALMADNNPEIGAPRKDQLDTLLKGLAEIFARYSGYDRSIQGISSSTNSRFIRFVRLVLKPFTGRNKTFHGTQTSLMALSARWARLLLEQREAGTI
jgi:hypothetical protein